MTFGFLASANADEFAMSENANGKKKMNGRRIFELLQFIGGGDCPGAADHFAGRVHRLPTTPTGCLPLQSAFIVFPVHDPINFFASQKAD